MLKPKVCHLTSVHPADDVRIFHKECVSLVSAGYDVTLIAPNVKNETNSGVKIIGIENKHTSRFYRMLKFTKKIYKKALEINADVYHFHDPELMPIGLKLKRKGKKVIYDVHEDLPKSIYGRYWIPKPLRFVFSLLIIFFESYVAKNLDGIITVTQTINNRFKKLNKNSTIINNYPILNDAVIKNKPVPKKKSQICYIGGISSIRGSTILIDALERINDNIILQIAGIFDPEDYRSELIVKKGWEKVVENGWVNRDITMKIMQESIAGIITYLPLPNHVNAQPNKLFEYMSAGIPVIASNFPKWKEIIESNACGICVNPLSSEEIAEAVVYLMKNPEKALKMGNNGRNAVLNLYNWEKEKINLFYFYENI
ncbi:MAG: glycosyltransferase family 4 protein [Chlorobi bacterium]|nr:glycosyltransferase family 4 protein [Chlorobiota bacterium]